MTAGLVLAGCGDSASSPAGTTTSDTADAVDAGTHVDRAGLVDIGSGRELFMECQGSGAPTVVLVAGLGERADNWSTTAKPDESAVFPEVAASSRVCAYDRPGTATASPSGWDMTASTAVPQPITADDAAVDLHALLEASGEPGPFVLVGHSFGGDIVRLYAGAHPSDVAGVVLVDALSEHLGDGLNPQQLADFESINRPEIQGRPPGSEFFDFTTLVEQLRAAPPMPPVPMMILTADTTPITAEAIASGAFPPFVDQAFADALWSAQVDAQDALAAMYPDAEHVTKTNSTHYIQVEQPQIVIDAIRDVRD